MEDKNAESKNTTRIRKLIDLDSSTVKSLQIQAINKDFKSVKEYMEHILYSAALENNDL